MRGEPGSRPTAMWLGCTLEGTPLTACPYSSWRLGTGYRCSTCRSRTPCRHCSDRGRFPRTPHSGYCSRHDYWRRRLRRRNFPRPPTGHAEMRVELAELLRRALEVLITGTRAVLAGPTGRAVDAGAAAIGRNARPVARLLVHATGPPGGGGGGGGGGGSLACAALCFLAFFRHVFLASPDFFLHVSLRSWAIASSWSCQPRRPSEPRSSPLRARRREPAVLRERVRVSKRVSSMGKCLGSRGRIRASFKTDSAGH
jgi:hypothetical protein